MTSYTLRRLLLAVPLLILVTFLAYLLINAAPGDPISMLVDPNQMDLRPEVVQARREALGLDKPFLVRYGIWLTEAVRGNLGYSYLTHRPVARVLLERLGGTAQLVGFALALIAVFAIPLGVLAGVRQRTWVDYVANVLGLFAVSVPSFFLALGLIYLLSLKLQFLPTAGMITLGQGGGVLDRLAHLVMPATTLALLSGADVMRYARAGIVDVLGEDYIRTARAKGVPAPIVLIRHGLRTGLLPLITVIGLRIPQLLGGAVITETIFQWPGMGLLSIQAIQSRDYPVLMGVLLVSAVIVVLVNLATDLIYGWVDPRISVAGT